MTRGGLAAVLLLLAPLSAASGQTEDLSVEELEAQAAIIFGKLCDNPEVQSSISVYEQLDSAGLVSMSPVQGDDRVILVLTAAINEVFPSGVPDSHFVAIALGYRCTTFLQSGRIPDIDDPVVFLASDGSGVMARVQKLSEVERPGGGE